MQELGELLVSEHPKKSIRLYEIADALEGVENALLENGGEITPEMEAEIEGWQIAFDAKVERICRVIANNERTASVFADEIDRLTKHRDAHENAAKRLKHYLFTVMQRSDTQKVVAGVFKVALQNNPPSIRLADPTVIPERYQRVRPVEFNGQAALAELKEANLIPDATGEFPIGEFIVSRSQHLRIR